MSLYYTFMSDIPYDVIKFKFAKTDEEQIKCENQNYEFISELNYHVFHWDTSKHSRYLRKLGDIYYSIPKIKYKPITPWGYGDIDIIKLKDIEKIYLKIKEFEVTSKASKILKKILINHLGIVIEYMKKHSMEIVYFGAI